MGATIGFDAQSGEEIEIGDIERRSGLYVLGKPGMGKSTLLANLLCQDVAHHNGACFLDPHKDTIDEILKAEIPYTYPRIFLYDPTVEDYAFALNPLRCANIESLKERTDVYTRTYNVFHKLWEDDWGPWLQLIIQNTIYVFIENQEYTLAEVPYFLTNTEFRTHLLKSVHYNLDAVDFWLHEFQPKQAEAALTRVRMLLGHTYVKHIVGQPETSLAIFLKYAIDAGWVVLFQLPASLAPDIRKFIGTLLISEVLHIARNRPRENRRQFCIFIDEFQTFASQDDLATLIVEARKFGIATTLAHQERLGQLGENQKVIGATLACANKILFQTTVKDAQELAQEFAHAPEEDMQAWRGGELVISPTPIQDIWARGHPHKEVMEARNRYFWLEDLLRSKPQDKYFEFNPDHIPHADPEVVGNLHLAEFSDWNMYRSSADMIRQGISLLNTYYYNVMSHTYTDANPVTEQQFEIIIKIIECFWGVLGFRPTMQPYLSSEKKQLFENVIAKTEIGELNDILPGLHPLRKEDYASIEARKEHKKLLLEQGSEIRQQIADISRYGSKVAVPRAIAPSDVSFVQSLALKRGMAHHDVEDLIDWEIRPIDPVEQRILRNLLRTISGMDKTNITSMDKYQQKMIDLTLQWRFGRKWDELANSDVPWDEQTEETKQAFGLPFRKAGERAVWQMRQMIFFIMHCIDKCGGVLAKEPIKSQSGKYDDTIKREKTQGDLITEMSQELSNLPRFVAYAKYIEEKDGEQGVQKRKIRTPPPPDAASEMEYNRRRELAIENAQAAGKPREAIERELQDRRESWRKKSDAGEPQSATDEPPPTWA